MKRAPLSNSVYGLWWGRGDSNSHAFRHMILNHARLPIPTLPRGAVRFQTAGQTPTLYRRLRGLSTRDERFTASFKVRSVGRPYRWSRPGKAA